MSILWRYQDTAAHKVDFTAPYSAQTWLSSAGVCSGLTCTSTGGNVCTLTAILPGGVTLFADSGEPGMITLNRNLFRPHGLNQKLTVSFNVQDNGDVSLMVYNSIGQRVKTLFKKGAVRRQQYNVDWDGTNDAGERVASGAYFVRLESTRYVITKKVALIK
jgi:hypothetical protein